WNTRTTTAVLRTASDYTPLSLEMKPRPSSAVISGGNATITEDGASRSFAAPARYFTVFGASPFAIQMMMLRYWKAHGSPAELPVLRSNAAALPVRIALAGHDSIRV